jgi:hypothetical protein
VIKLTEEQKNMTMEKFIKIYWQSMNNCSKLRASIDKAIYSQLKKVVDKAIQGE